MRLYHWVNHKYFWLLTLVLLSAAFSGCTGPKVTQGLITISIHSDNKEIQLKLESGSTVQEAIEEAQIGIGEMDRVVPPLYTVLSDGSQVGITRVREEYYIEQEIIPFDHQEILNDALPEGESRLSQPGINGLKELTYHRVYEDGKEVSNAIVKTTILEVTFPEIVMIGSRSSFASVKIPGKIAFLSVGNAWVIEEITANRKLVVSTGDLDGRIFSLSKNGKYLLFTRFTNQENSINSLWVALIESEPPEIIELGIKNIVHFAEFDPFSEHIAYSTVEWRETAPGWQANNDLYIMSINANGIFGKPQMLLESNSGGVYGWWGTNFIWSPDGKNLLYSRPDGIGVFDIAKKTLATIYNIKPYQTEGNWAWIPPVSWSPDSKVIFVIDHQLKVADGLDGIVQFDLIAMPLNDGPIVHLADDVGMFSYPVSSPMQLLSNFINTISQGNLTQDAYSVAYLQAVFPDQSDVSGYRLIYIDRDGSNKKGVFPDEGAAGIDPQRVTWSPDPLSTEGNYSIAVIYNGNLWLVDPATGLTNQITGDGLTSHIDWR